MPRRTLRQGGNRPGCLLNGFLTPNPPAFPKMNKLKETALEVRNDIWITEADWQL